jgi:phosphohistidine swiveling domain-containing protein
MIPGVSIQIKNGQLGQALQTRDGVVGLVCTGLATNAILNTPVLLTSIDDYTAVALSLLASTFTRATTVATITTPSAHGLSTGNTVNVTVTSDALAIPVGIYTVTVLTATTFTFTCLNAGAVSGTVTVTTSSLNDAFAAKHVTEFYNEAGKGTRLYLLLVAETQTMVQTLDNTFAAGAKKLLDFANGDIKVLGVVRNPTGEATVPTNFFRADVMAAIPGATALVNAYRAQHTPIRILLGGRVDVTTNVPQDLKLQTNNAVGVVCGDTSATSNNAAVGLVLGKVAKAPVSTSIARVKDGPLVGITAAYIGATLSENFSQRTVLIDKGAITLTTYYQRTGYYLSDDQMAAVPTDDYTNLVNGRVIDKAQRISYQVYVDELHNAVPIDPITGLISPEVVKSLEGKIEQAVRTAMGTEVSSFDAFIDPNQNILATGKLVVNESIVPFGYTRKIEIILGLSNPFN